VGLLSAIVIGLFARAILRPRRPAPGAERDLAVYRDQLGELDRDVARGLMPEGEAASARLEIQRRLLAAAGTSTPAPRPASPRQQSAAIALLALLLVPAAAVVIYLDLGTPGLPGMPFASRAPAPSLDQDLVKIVDLLNAKVKASPGDPKGWTLLAEAEGRLARYKESADAYAQAIARTQASGGTVDAGLLSLYGEALAAASDGQVTPKATAALSAALALDPKDPRARYYLALGQAQAGHLEAALSQWVALEADAAPDAPWRAMLAGQIDTAARQLGRDPATLPGRRQPPAASAGTGGPTPEQQAAFIQGMVSGLADKLKAKPDDVDGWLKLANAYDKLGRAEDARAAWREAATRAPDRLDAQLAYVGALAPLADSGPLPADFPDAVARIRKLAPGNGLGLYCAGLVARAQGDKAGAKALWQQVLPLIPEGTPQRQELEAKIAALGQ
jgi:cytochrome c-type biogenesis protein CcmH